MTYVSQRPLVSLVPLEGQVRCVCGTMLLPCGCQHLVVLCGDVTLSHVDLGFSLAAGRGGYEDKASVSAHLA